MLDAIFGLPELIGRWVATGVIEVINLVIAALGAILAMIFSVLPKMPDAPAPPESGFLAWFAWLVPVGSILVLLGLFLSCYLALLVWRIALRWAKAL